MAVGSDRGRSGHGRTGREAEGGAAWAPGLSRERRWRDEDEAHTPEWALGAWPVPAMAPARNPGVRTRTRRTVKATRKRHPEIRPFNIKIIWN